MDEPTTYTRVNCGANHGVSTDMDADNIASRVEAGMRMKEMIKVTTTGHREVWVNPFTVTTIVEESR